MFIRHSKFVDFRKIHIIFQSNQKISNYFSDDFSIFFLLKVSAESDAPSSDRCLLVTPCFCLGDSNFSMKWTTVRITPRANT